MDDWEIKLDANGIVQKAGSWGGCFYGVFALRHLMRYVGAGPVYVSS